MFDTEIFIAFDESMIEVLKLRKINRTPIILPKFQVLQDDSIVKQYILKERKSMRGASSTIGAVYEKEITFLSFYYQV